MTRMISLIAAVAQNGVIGQKNDLPWNLPADLAYFKKITTGHTVMMGRRTYDSVIKQLGHPLPNRKNIVVTSHPDSAHPEAIFVPTVEQALQHAGDEEVFVVGGAMLYQATLPIASRLYLTEIDAAMPGDTYFPVWNQAEWRLEKNEFRAKDDKNPYDMHFRVYVKK